MPDLDLHRAPLSRRVIVAGAAAIGAGMVAAACGSPAKPGAAGSSASTSAGPLGPVSEVPVGGGKIYSSHGVVVTQAAAGQFAAFSTVCPHQGCSVNAVTDGQIVCPCHGSRFALDGSVQQGPARTGLDPRPVRVEGGEIVIG